MRKALGALASTLLDFLYRPVLNRLGVLHDVLLRLEYRQFLDTFPNAFARYGLKVFSQTDEDGLTLEITKRIGLAHGVFAEFGVGDGGENNTLVLLSCGWSGIWAGGEKLHFEVPQSSKRLAFRESWITRENILTTVRSGLAQIERQAVDVISIDLDGNDLYVAEELLQGGLRPALFIVEYNAKFPPPIRWAIAYDPNHRYDGGDYFGASLASLEDLFTRHGYFLVCCNAHSGGNAFFVREQYRELFPEVPHDTAQIYCPPRYQPLQSYGYPSVKTILALIRDERLP